MLPSQKLPLSPPSRSELLDRITRKLYRVDNMQALQLLDELLDKRGIAEKLVRSRAFIKML